MLTDVDEADGCNVDSNELSDCKIDKVKGKAVDLRMVFVDADGTKEEPLESAGKISENELPKLSAEI